MKRKLLRIGSGFVIGLGLMLILRFGFKLSFSFFEQQESQPESLLSGSALIIKPAVLTGGEIIDVSSIVYGKMIRPLVTIGEEVKGGQPILEIQDSQMHYADQAQYENTRLQLSLEAKKGLWKQQETITLLQKKAEKAEQNYHLLLSQRDKSLQEEKLSPELISNLASKLESAEKDFRTSKAALAEAKSEYFSKKENIVQQISSAELAYQDALYQYAALQLRAPVSWTVAEILLTGGQDVEKGQLAFRLSHPIKQLEILVNSWEFLERNQDSTLDMLIKDKKLKASVLTILPSENITGAYLITLEPSEPLIPTWEVAQVILHKK